MQLELFCCGSQLERMLFLLSIRHYFLTRTVLLLFGDGSSPREKLLITAGFSLAVSIVVKGGRLRNRSTSWSLETPTVRLHNRLRIRIAKPPGALCFRLNNTMNREKPQAKATENMLGPADEPQASFQ
ncbi:hypothetical protein EYF80_015873 [Liparis tanakae]|uniref:Uncharacterized protein n=1 Tax=Liparis tanakae TaxID=230148 RepID=A0A4Z2I725_9TELE|nr:hypothetical protein EYF80_015873 [Liparis tanakae]